MALSLTKGLYLTKITRQPSFSIAWFSHNPYTKLFLDLLKWCTVRWLKKKRIPIIDDEDGSVGKN